MAFSLPKRGLHLPTAQHVNVQVHDLLTPVTPVVYHDPRSVAEPQRFVLGNLSRRNEQLPQDVGVLRGRFAQRRQAVPVLRNHENVGGGERIDILEGEDVLVFLHDRGGYFWQDAKESPRQ